MGGCSVTGPLDGGPSLAAVLLGLLAGRGGAYAFLVRALRARSHGPEPGPASLGVLVSWARPVSLRAGSPVWGTVDPADGPAFPCIEARPPFTPGAFQGEDSPLTLGSAPL